MDHVSLREMGPFFEIFWTHRLIWNVQGLCNVSSSKDTMASIKREVDDIRIPDAMSSHRLIEV